jgi:hypothetical protein
MYRPNDSIIKRVPKPSANDARTAIINSTKIFLDPLFIWYTKYAAVNDRPT